MSLGDTNPRTSFVFAITPTFEDNFLVPFLIFLLTVKSIFFYLQAPHDDRNSSY
jgi:hypothetical protein